MVMRATQSSKSNDNALLPLPTQPVRRILYSVQLQRQSELENVDKYTK